MFNHFYSPFIFEGVFCHPDFLKSISFSLEPERLKGVTRVTLEQSQNQTGGFLKQRDKVITIDVLVFLNDFEGVESTLL